MQVVVSLHNWVVVPRLGFWTKRLPKLHSREEERKNEFVLRYVSQHGASFRQSAAITVSIVTPAIQTSANAQKCCAIADYVNV